MQAKVLAAHEAPPSNGQWQAVAVVDVEILVNLIPVIIRGITVRTKPQEGKTFFGMRSMKRDEEWAQIVEFPEHGKEVQAALLEAWNTWNKQPKPQTESKQPVGLDTLMRFAAVDVNSIPAQHKPTPNRAILEECPF
jgi:hypothetical protein